MDALEAESVFEIANPFPFRGTTYIGKTWADDKRRDPSAIRLPPQPARQHAIAGVEARQEVPARVGAAVHQRAGEACLRLAQQLGSFAEAGRQLGLTRSAVSVAANLAEGAGRAGRDRSYHWRIAYGSALESRSHLEMLLRRPKLPA